MATVTYIFDRDGEFVPCGKDEANLIKVMFDDRTLLFATPVKEAQEGSQAKDDKEAERDL
jgi:hypothetical protein